MSTANVERQRRQQLAAAVAPRYGHAGSFAHQFAKNKIRHDPFFTDLFHTGLAATAAAEGVDVLDLGCGQGLLAMAMVLAHPALPLGSYHGIEYSAANVARAQAAFATLDAGQRRLTCVQGDIAAAPLPSARWVTAIDVLHYLQPAQQEQVLRRVHAALAGNGKLLLRVGDADVQRSNRWSRWIDGVVSGVRGGGRQVHCRSLPEWLDLLRALGFMPRVISTARSAFYANVLIVAERF